MNIGSGSTWAGTSPRLGSLPNVPADRDRRDHVTEDLPAGAGQKPKSGRRPPGIDDLPERDTAAEPAPRR